MNPRYLFFLCLLACSQYEVDPTSFINIETVSSVDPQGSPDLHAAISDLAVYIDAKYLGTYPLGSTIPFLGEGNHQLQIFPIVRTNTLSSMPVVYPFYAEFMTNLNLSTQENVSVFPQFIYKTTSKLAFSEDFQFSNLLNVDLDQDFATKVEITNGLDGKAAILEVSQNNPVLETTHSFPMRNLPVDGSAAYLELDVWGQGTGIFVGIKGNDTGGVTAQQYKVYIFPSEQRKRQYIEFSPELKSSQFSDYQLLFKVIWDDQADLETQSVLLDNLKFLHF